MYLLFKQNERGHSWDRDHYYYLCTQEEYEELLKEYEGFDNSKSRNKKVSIGGIYAHPQTIVLDGYCSHGGREFRAQGISVKHVMGVSEDCSTYKHYIKPGSIEKNDKAETKEWWA